SFSFSSRRRHTRSTRDWSSDVCSSDLVACADSVRVTRARRDAQLQRFMTVPGVGPIPALAFKATIDDPARSARSRSVGAYVGLKIGRASCREGVETSGGAACAAEYAEE